MFTIRNLSFAYGRKPVLNNLDLQLPGNEVHGILGPNGAGKTTLFQLIAGALKPPPGTVLWQNQTLHKEQTAFLETNPYFYPYLQGVEYLRLICNDSKAIQQWNRLFDLPLDQLTDGYSTGMQKKLAFIGVLLQKKPVLVLDEPFNGVDFAGNEMMMAVIRRHCKIQGITLIASHILSTLTQVCDRISVLENGRIAQTFEKQDFAAMEAQIRTETDELLDKTLRDSF